MNQHVRRRSDNQMESAGRSAEQCSPREVKQTEREGRGGRIRNEAHHRSGCSEHESSECNHSASQMANGERQQCGRGVDGKAASTRQ